MTKSIREAKLAVLKAEKELFEARRAFKEGQLTIQQARKIAKGGRNGFGFEAHDAAGMKQGIALMQKQLQDMEAHPNRYIQALQNGFVIAGFGGDLFGVEVPETLMTGEVPAGMTPKQAFEEVVDYMQQVIAEAQKTALPGSRTALPKKATAYLESRKREALKKLNESSFSSMEDYDEEIGMLVRSDAAVDMAFPDIPKNVRRIIASWYNAEGAYEDFEDSAEMADFIGGDIIDMLDAASDPEDAAAVRKALGEAGYIPYFEDDDELEESTLKESATDSEKYAIVSVFDGEYAPRCYYGAGIWDDFDEEDLDSDAWSGLNRTLVNLRQVQDRDELDDDVMVYTMHSGEEFSAKEFLEKYDLRESERSSHRKPRLAGRIR